MRLPVPAPSVHELLSQPGLAAALPRVLADVDGPLVDGRYLHWDVVRHRTPPAGLTAEEWWLGLALARQPMLRPIPLISADGRPFRYSLPDPVLELLHWIDQHASGEVMVSETIRDRGDQRRYLVNSLIEEAVTSSQLEGANATRKVAKQMIRSGRPPRDRAERMILNNYLAMTDLRGLASAPLTPSVVFSLHRTLTEGTLDDPTAAGRLQEPSEERVHVAWSDGTVTHVPPPADQLRARLEAMCRYANGGGKGFTHPVVRAVLLHLWLAYDHPFEDGNGRTARALFYREMLSSGYWLFEYVSISRLLLKAPSQYGLSFLYAETDGFDATYFLLYQLGILKRAIEELLAYLVRKMAEVRETEALLRRTDLNHRQVALLTHALRHRDAVYTVHSHGESHRVTRQSARADLLDLERRGLLDRRVIGRRFEFIPVPDLRERLHAASVEVRREE
ncbi:MAG: Fic family protein [Chloroflexota bacterium]